MNGSSAAFNVGGTAADRHRVRQLGLPGTLRGVGGGGEGRGGGGGWAWEEGGGGVTKCKSRLNGVHARAPTSAAERACVYERACVACVYSQAYSCVRSLCLTLARVRGVRMRLNVLSPRKNRAPLRFVIDVIKRPIWDIIVECRRR